MRMRDVTSLLSLEQVDHSELLDILSIRYRTCWRVSRHAIAFPASANHKIKLQISHGRVEKVLASEALTEAELYKLVEQIEADLKDDRIVEYGVEILFADRPVTGDFRFTALPMQILEAPAEAPRPPHLSAHHPFVLEYPIRAYATPDLRIRRRFKNAIEWAWVLNALLSGSITTYSSPRSPQLWAIREDVFTPFWASKSYSFQGSRIFLDSLSEPSSPAPVLPAATYFGGRRNPAWPDWLLDAFCLPDNLDRLVSAFVGLDRAKRRRFLRSAAAIYAAHELWDLNISSYFLMCVQALETLIDRPPPVRCRECKMDMGSGPTRLFHEFVERYCADSGVEKKVITEIYSVRSALAHGHYLFQLDEAPWSFNMGATTARASEDEIYRSAIQVSKAGLRNWLVAQ